MSNDPKKSPLPKAEKRLRDRKSTRLNSSHLVISYAVFCLKTLLRPDFGEVRVAGLDPVHDPQGVRARMGWMPDVFGVYEQLPVREYLAFFAEAYRLDRTTPDPRITGAPRPRHPRDNADPPAA